MEGSENLRWRGPHQNSGLESTSKPASKTVESASSPEGEKPDDMAAGSSRIIRYVLFAFFVRRSAYQSQSLISNSHSRVS